MAKVLPGRFTAGATEPFVVFLIGMRVNRLLAPHKWLPTAMAMGPMLSTLYQHKDKGMLHAQVFFYWRGIGLVQYWRSFEDLERFSRSREEPHLSAWQRYARKVGADGSVGIWHETYMVEPSNYECVYANMPPFGLAAATKPVPAVGARETARLRLRGKAAAGESEAQVD